MIQITDKVRAGFWWIPPIIAGVIGFLGVSILLDRFLPDLVPVIPFLIFIALILWLFSS